MVRVRVGKNHRMDIFRQEARRSQTLRQLSRVGAERPRARVDQDPRRAGIDEHRYIGGSNLRGRRALGRQDSPSGVGQFAVGQSPAVIIADAESLSAFHELLLAVAAHYSMLSK